MTILEEIAVSEQIKTLCTSVKKPGRVSAPIFSIAVT